MKAAKAIELISPIPSENFITDRFSDGESKCCVVGHLCRLISDKPNDYSALNCKDMVRYDFVQPPYPADGKEEVFELRKKSGEFLIKQHGIIGRDISCINNYAGYNGYVEPEVKDRVLHLLKDMDAAGY